MSQILREIGNIARALDYISNVEFKDIHLNKGQYLYLSRIYENPGIINDNLAKLVKNDRTAVAKTVKHLEQEQLILKKADSTNKKIRCLFVTQKGEKLHDYLQREEKYSSKQALANLSLKEQKQLLNLLKIVSSNVSFDWDFVRQGYKRNYE
ncbi:MarR family transcriptional regulator [Tetragenococcus halophilus]|uniref:MarR family transcriptional regulator n=3 Tax=Tetragenococcus TaxID=51668 RepID=A0A091BXI2_9ENTE|nr:MULTISPECIES: MarR family transcriptional regulator [Tetragenococcus]MDN6147092.1 MarR family transcriptional regulator [Tetragenococcus koreensis]MDN6640392.1 MarR family transcriptional regulator [Tetragenococcus sp.]MDN6750702.1 MarR family transcriptional regulator [Staphylococcus equorum]AOF49875.1 MarR family transcriptional regulator [Tetragenococcus halophilus]KFN89190.1 MarR family transcriptional regulator [Tetragenococcus muriaticus 3MR10-3]